MSSAIAIGTRPDVQQLKTKIDNLIAQDWISPARNQSFGELNFEQVVPLLSAGSELIKALGRIDLNLLPPNRIQAINGSLDNYQGVFSQIKSFDLKQTNSPQLRNSIMDQFRSTYNQLFDSLSTPLGIWAATTIDFGAVKRDLAADLKGAISESEANYRLALSGIENASKQANEALSAIQEAAGKVGVTSHAKVFSDQASEHLAASKIWIGFTFAALIAMILWGFIALKWLQIPDNAGSGAIAQEIFTRIIVFSGISYALVWCARNYSANRHNYILNKHRQNSLSTFEAFVSAAEGDADTKNAVLIQATTSIFSAQATGYAGKETDVDQPSRILEIFKSAKGT